MSCVVCLTARANVERVSSCSALLCRGCLLAFLDKGKERCVVCVSRYQPSAIVNACLFGLRGSADDSSNPAKPYIKLAVAFSNAGSPRCAMRVLSIAHTHTHTHTHTQQ